MILCQPLILPHRLQYDISIYVITQSFVPKFSLNDIVIVEYRLPEHNDRFRNDCDICRHKTAEVNKIDFQLQFLQLWWPFGGSSASRRGPRAVCPYVRNTGPLFDMSES